jgi:hypothetical protein
MKSKRFTIAVTLLAVALAASKAHGLSVRADEPDSAAFGRVLQRVRLAFKTRNDCRGLFSKYRVDPQEALNRAIFINVGDQLTPFGFAAVTFAGTNWTLIGNQFYAKPTDVDGRATLLIHELLHQQGAGKEIDDYVNNYEMIARACGTRNSAK